MLMSCVLRLASPIEVSTHNTNSAAILCGRLPCCVFLAIYATPNVECGPNKQAKECVISMHSVILD